MDGKLTAYHAKALEGHVSGCRGLAAKQIAYQSTPIPLPFYHLMMFIVNVFILLMGWNSAVRLVSDYQLDEVLENDLAWAIFTEAFGNIFVIVFFNVLLRIAEGFTNPYGNDACDYHLDFDLNNLWDEAKETIANMVKSKVRTRHPAPRRVGAANSL